jgi:hypothetical protein
LEFNVDIADLRFQVNLWLNAENGFEKLLDNTEQCVRIAVKGFIGGFSVAIISFLNLLTINTNAIH